MRREAIAPHGLFASSAPLTTVILSGDLVVVSGQVPFDAEGGRTRSRGGPVPGPRSR
jgi:enamine deaminase RidA (YjgF/YER057c/UK114 family)